MSKEAQHAVVNSIQFEAKKDGCQQQQSGEWKLTLKLHPDQVSQALMLAAPGQRYMCVLVAVGDDENSIPPDTTPTTNGQTEKPKQERSPGSQAAYLCTLPEFQKWIVDRTFCPGDRVYNENEAKQAIYLRFGITSRTDLKDTPEEWAAFVAKYRADSGRTAEQR